MADGSGVLVQPILLSEIRRNGGTQPRCQMNAEAVMEYAEAMEQGDRFPPIKVYFDGTDYWLADGFHRVAAAEMNGVPSIPAEVYQGTRRDAVLFSCQANSRHGLRRTNDDKRRAVLCLLLDEEWANWSDREIGRRCCVSHQMVAAMRTKHVETGPNDQYQERTFIHPKTQKPTVMRTARIGGAWDKEIDDGIVREPLSEEEAKTLARVEAVAPHIKSVEAVIERIATLPAFSTFVESIPQGLRPLLNAAQIRKTAKYLMDLADALD